MPETDATEMVDEELDAVETDEVEAAEELQDDPAEKLKKALRSEREARRTAERERNTLRQQLEDKDKPAEDAALEAARREAVQTVNDKANARIIRSELKALAAGKVSRPDLLLKVADLSAIAVDDDGEPDADALADAVASFLEDYPELAVGTQKFTGSADQGAKGRKPTPGQVTKQELDSMSPSQINQARREGRLKTLLGTS